MTKILIVDDNLEVGQMLHHHLTGEGYEVIEAKNSKMAMEIIKETLPEVVLLDVKDATGFEICQQLRKTPECELIYIILLTELTESKYKVKGLDHGADDYVTKPFDIPELLARIRVGDRTVIKKREATIDKLTKVYNKDYFYMYLAQEASRASRYKRQLSLIMSDIDHFKRINDDYGLLIGDTILKQIALVIKRHSRNSDLVARWGGEEFVVLLPETSLEGGAIVAERIRQSLASQNFPHVQQITASFGVASLVTNGRNLLYQADLALNEAKANGRNKVVVMNE
jgi:two-component system cell cycle response regulator